MKQALSAFVLLLVLVGLCSQGDEPQTPPVSNDQSPPPMIRAATSTNTGLLLEPPVDLAWFTREKFVAESSTIGAETIHKAWTSPVVTLPPHARANVHGLTEDEVKDYMRLPGNCSTRERQFPCPTSA